jgi:hypothetical protein
MEINHQQLKNIELKKALLCPKCREAFGYRVRRGILFKTILIALPVTRYYCYTCKQKRYVWKQSNTIRAGLNVN